MVNTNDSARKHVVDALFVPIVMLTAWSLADVTTIMTVSPITLASSNFNVMNLDKWNSLPDDIKDLLTKTSEDAAEWSARCWWYGDLTCIDSFLGMGKGRKVIYPPASDYSVWDDPIKSITDDYIANMTAKGIPAADYLKWLREHINYLNANHLDEKTCRAWYEKEILKK